MMKGFGLIHWRHREMLLPEGFTNSYKPLLIIYRIY